MNYGTSCFSFEQLTPNKQILCISRSLEKTVRTRIALEKRFITLQAVHQKNYEEAGWFQAPSLFSYRAVLLGGNCHNIQIT